MNAGQGAMFVSFFLCYVGGFEKNNRTAYVKRFITSEVNSWVLNRPEGPVCIH
jgi:hypothetical protein